MRDHLYHLYFLSLFMGIMEGYESSVDFNAGITGNIVGVINGFLVGLIVFTILLFSEKIIWVRVQDNQDQSLWAVIGVTYFLFVLLFCPIFTAIITENMTVLFMSLLFT